MKQQVFEDMFNLDKVATGYNDTTDEIARNKSQRLLSEDNTQQEVYLDYCYITMNGHKYLATVANCRTLIIKWEKIEPASKSQEEDPMTIPFPVSI